MGSKQTHFLRNTRIPFKGRGRVGNRATEKCSRGLGSVTNTYSSIARFNAPSPDTTKHKQNHQLLKLVWGVGAGGGGKSVRLEKHGRKLVAIFKGAHCIAT